MYSKTHINKKTSLAILMCTKNGEKYIEKQLESIKNQSICTFDIFILDNKSNDKTLEIIHNFIKKNAEISIKLLKGNNYNIGNSFLYLAKQIPTEYKFYAFCDQDDIWLENHLQRGIDNIISYDDDPALTCSRTCLINQSDKKIGFSKNFMRKPSFQNALVQSIAGGNTMIFNNESFKIFFNSREDLNVVSHDWLLYILVTAAGGEVKYDKTPTVLYRQHENNAIGSNRGIINKLKRFSSMLAGNFNHFCMSNFEHLKYFQQITNENKKTFKLLENCFREKKLLKRLYYFHKSKVYRQTFEGQIALLINFIIR